MRNILHKTIRVESVSTLSSNAIFDTIDGVKTNRAFSWFSHFFRGELCSSFFIKKANRFFILLGHSKYCSRICHKGKYSGLSSFTGGAGPAPGPWPPKRPRKDPAKTPRKDPEKTPRKDPEKTHAKKSKDPIGGWAGSAGRGLRPPPEGVENIFLYDNRGMGVYIFL
jgi:hypothetical protein